MLHHNISKFVDYSKARHHGVLGSVTSTNALPKLSDSSKKLKENRAVHGSNRTIQKTEVTAKVLESDKRSDKNLNENLFEQYEDKPTERTDDKPSENTDKKAEVSLDGQTQSKIGNSPKLPTNNQKSLVFAEGEAGGSTTLPHTVDPAEVVAMYREIGKTMNRKIGDGLDIIIDNIIKDRDSKIFLTQLLSLMAYSLKAS